MLIERLKWGEGLPGKHKTLSCIPSTKKEKKKKKKMSGNKFSWLPIWILYSLVVGGGGVFSLTLSDKEPPRMEVLHTILRSSVASKFWKVVLNL
jgi:hypothetical protein